MLALANQARLSRELLQNRPPLQPSGRQRLRCPPEEQEIKFARPSFPTLVNDRTKSLASAPQASQLCTCAKYLLNP